MMSASAISKAIREKKKKLEAPKDATDIQVLKNHEEGERLSENTPDEQHEEAPTLESGADEDSAGAEISEPEDPKQINQPEDGLRENRKAKIRKMLSKMGK